MKKNDWLLAVSTLLFSSLFYEQHFGLNVLLFNCFLIVGYILRSQPNWRTAPIYLPIFGVLLAGVAMFLYGSLLSFFANLLAVGWLSATAGERRTSVFAGVLFSIYSGITSGFYMIFNYLKRQEETPNQKRPIGKFVLWLIPFLLVLLFFVLYREANPVFDRFAADVDLSFISIDWMVFTLAGLWLSYAFFNHQRLQPFSAYDAETANSLPVSENSLKVLGYHLNVAEEVRSGAILLFILNGLLLLVNGLDLGYFISGQIPEGMSYSEYVHEGTAALIVSILLAIGIITVYFRNQLSTLINHRIVRVLAYSWLIQNMVSVFFTLYRNQLYINEYSLTYKRIGVYLFLLMALIGLVFTLIKIAGQKSNYYLIRVNSVAFVVVLIISSLIPWDTLILNYNITKAKRTGVMDVEYLLDLSNEALPYLKALNRTYPLADPIQNNKLKQRIARANHNFLQDRHEFDWRSLTVRNERVYNRLLERFKKERR